MGERRRRLVLGAVWVGAATAAVLGGCGEGGDAILTERSDSSGVEIVMNSGADRALEWRFEPVLRLGGAEAGPESFYAVDRGLVDVDGRGRIHVLDAPGHRVVQFDTSGTHVGALGREGGGPGELEQPVGLAVSRAGVVGVYDYGKRGLVRWGAGGESMPLQRMPGLYRGPVFLVTSRGVILPVVDTSAAADVLLLEVGRDTVTLVAHDEPDAPMHRYRSCPVGLRQPPLFHPALTYAAAPDGRVMVHRVPEYRVEVHLGDSVVASWRRDVAPAAATPELARREVGEGRMIRWGGGECMLDPDEIIEARGVAPTVPAVSGLAVAPDGSVWVRRGGVGDEPRPIDILDASGLYVGTLPAGAPWPLAFTPGGDVAAMERDSLDVERIVVYRVAREGPAR